MQCCDIHQFHVQSNSSRSHSLTLPLSLRDLYCSISNDPITHSSSLCCYYPLACWSWYNFKFRFLPTSQDGESSDSSLVGNKYKQLVPLIILLYSRSRLSSLAIVGHQLQIHRCLQRNVRDPIQTLLISLVVTTRWDCYYHNHYYHFYVSE